MEERKTAAIVLPIVALIVIFFTVILPEIRYKSTHTISFKTCTVNFNYFDDAGFDSDVDRVSNNKLALCLCNVYTKKPDTIVGNKIIKICRQYGSHNTDDSIRWDGFKNLDSIIKNEHVVFDTLIYLD